MRRSRHSFQLYLIGILFFLLIFFQPETAEARVDGCCEKTTTGEYCQYTALSNCDTNYNIASQQTCDQTTFCQPVCCVDNTQGICYANVGAATCVAQGGTIDVTNPSCAGVNACQLGCCNLGTQCNLLTETQCKNVAAPFPGLDPNAIFDGTITDRSRCTLQCQLEEEGCCVSGSTCSYGTGSRCQSGTFYENIYCSNSNLPCSCTPQATKGCLPEEEDVYWFDSCGNKEGIAEDCDYAGGSTCSEVDGNFICKNLNCGSTKTYTRNYQDPQLGGSRLNTESWCVYESNVIGGNDLVGSRHYRATCLEGEEILEPCKDKREEICVNLPPEGTPPLGKAECRENKAEQCALECNEDNLMDKFLTNKACCLGYKDSCTWADGQVAEKFLSFLETTQTEDLTEAQLKDFLIGTLPYLEKEDYSQDELRFITTQLKRILENITYSQEEIDGFIQNILENVQEPYNYEDLKFLVHTLLTTDPLDFEGRTEELNTYVLATIQPSFVPAPFGYCQPNTPVGFDLNQKEEENEGDSKEKVCHIASVSCRSLWDKPPFSGWDCRENCHCMTEDYILGMKDFCHSLGDCGASYNVVGDYTSGGMEISGSNMPTYTRALERPFTYYSEAHDYAGIPYIPEVFDQFALASTRASRGSRGSFAGTGMTDQLSSALLGIEGPFTRIGRRQTREHIFTCKPWRPPANSDNCELCQQNPDGKPCSEYKCESLGRDCTYLETEQLCVAEDPRDPNAPTITPDEKVLTEGYNLQTTPTGYYIQPEVPAYNDITFGIKTDEVAKCKISDEITESYEEMTTFFGTEEYTNTFEVTLNLAPGQGHTYYIRCEDIQSNSNEAAYTIQFSTSTAPDLEPPRILLTSPQSGARVPTGVTEVDLHLYLNEPSGCKWSNQDEDYTLMPSENDFACDSTPVSIYSNYECIGTLTEIQPNVATNYYIRCLDIARNVQPTSTPFTLQGT